MTIVPGDLALAALGVVAAACLLRERLPRAALWPLATGGAFAALVLATALANGSSAFVAGAKLVELGALTLGAVVLVRSRARLEAVVDLLIAFTLAADAYALYEFVASGGGRQASFLGEHDFAALATIPLVYGLALVYEGRTGRRAWLAIVAGAIGVSLGAALASLVGLYLGTVALVAVAAWRRQLRLRSLLVTAVVVAAVTGATLTLRSGELGFLQSWFGKEPERPGQYAASWSQRLIFAYVGGRVFLDHPALGTGWWGLLPPKEYVEYLPDARRRFADQPSHYFPPADRAFIPQQAYDQVLYELGLVGGATFAAFLATLAGCAVAAARRTARELAYLPAVWLGAALGALAGAGLYGGAPIAAVFFLSAGLVVSIPLVRDA